jgi:hypothetical protein
MQPPRLLPAGDQIAIAEDEEPQMRAAVFSFREVEGVGFAPREGGWCEGYGCRPHSLGGNPVRGDYPRRGRGEADKRSRGGGLQAMIR